MHKAFTLVELAVVIFILAVLSGALVPIVMHSIENSNAVKIIYTLDTLKVSCQHYISDIGGYGREYPYWYQPAHTYYHRFTLNSGNINWNGPYSERLDANANPYWESGMYLYSSAQDFPPVAFGVHNWAWLPYVPEGAAKIIDDHLDKNIWGDWKTRGKVRYEGGVSGIRVSVWEVWYVDSIY